MELDPVTTKLVSLALDASLLRHNAISSNIANANTAGYAPIAVDFEQHLGAQKASLLDRSMDKVNVDTLKAVTPKIRQLENGLTGRIAVDMEMVKLNKNTLQYQALLEGLSKNISIVRMAIMEGK